MSRDDVLGVALAIGLSIVLAFLLAVWFGVIS